MHPGRGAFADREQARQAGPSVRSGGDPAHVIVSRRGDRDRRLARVQPGPHTGGEHHRKFLREAGPDRAATIQKGTAPAGPRRVHRTRHHIARLQVGVRRLAQKEVAVPVDQPRALAPQGLGGQRHGVQTDINGGRMELHELGVENFRARAIRRRHAFTQQGGGGGGVDEQAAGTARGQHHGGGQDLDHPPRTGCPSLDQGAAHPAAGVLNQTAQPPIFPDLDMRRGTHRRDQGRQDRPARSVAADPCHAGV